MKDPIDLAIRMRRNRKSGARRALVRETSLNVTDLIQPLFLLEGEKLKVPVASMPGVFKYSLDFLLEEVQSCVRLGIPAVALFPCLEDSQKDPLAKESRNPDGLLPSAVREIKKHYPNMVVITDVAMDPYSSDGHDGFVKDGEILNDETLPILAQMAIVQAHAGADYVAPSDMMDGRVAFIRGALDREGLTDVGILSYSAKYASALYGPFRDALESSPKCGDKKGYQMDPANVREAIREVKLDIKEGADIVMVKPALAYLDVVSRIRSSVDVPLAVYHVSGEYAMVKAAAERGWIDGDAVMMETLTSMKRAGADMIFTYFATRAAEILKNAKMG